MSNRSIFEKNRALFDRVIALRSMIQPDTGRRLDITTAPLAAAERFLTYANKRESKKVANWRATVNRDAHRLEEAQKALNLLKQQRKKIAAGGRQQIDNLIRVKESQMSLLKERLSVEQKELLAIENGTARWLIDDRNQATIEADCIREWHSSRLRFITHELEQKYESEGGFAKIKAKSRRDMAELVLLVAALIVDPDAEEWSPRLTGWQDLPWEVRTDGERKDGSTWIDDDAEMPPTRRAIGEMLLGRNSEVWLHIVKEAVIVMKQVLANSKKTGDIGNHSGEEFTFEPLCKKDREVLIALAKDKSTLQRTKDLIDKAGCQKAAPKASIKSLEEKKLVVRPPGTHRKGVVITEKGLAWLKNYGDQQVPPS